MSKFDVVSQVTSAYIENGILGITIILLLIVSSILMMNILKDKKQDKNLITILSKNNENQERFILMFEKSQEKNNAILKVLEETLEIERSNTKDCYSKVSNKLDKLFFNIEKLQNDTVR